MLPFFYQIGYVKDLKDKPIKIIIDNNDLCLFKDKKTEKIKLVSDRCPHRFYSLSKGEQLGDSGILCGYHNLCFHKGDSPDLTNNLRVIGENIYFCPTSHFVDEPYFPPEHYDKNFRVIEGSCKVKTNINVFLENVIDNTHILYVHSFGMGSELPSNIKLQRLSEYGLRQTFDFKTGKQSLSYQIQKMKKKKPILKVENEYHMPANVLSRVHIDETSTKTVFVRAFPINEKETIIFWKIYRNFLVFDAELFNILGDILFKLLFEYTLQEDIGILKNVYLEDTSSQFHTKYDKIQVEFRKDLNKYKHFHGPV
jgi:phenylpropionate dioxygenase-like ring-hydroxylating dioxygenase large terminal subunit